MKSALCSFAVLVIITLFGCTQKHQATTDRMANATRLDSNGWIYVHLSGSPADIGYQHGYLLANEIDTLLKVMKYYLPYSSKKDWNFYRKAVADFVWKKVDPEYQAEIKGITEGMAAKGMKYDTLDITALNAYIELSSYYVPTLMNKAKPGSGDNKAPGNCSAFIATGSTNKVFFVS